MSSNKGSGSSRLLSPELKARSAGLYTVARDKLSITCNVCGHVSHDPQDVQAKFCPQCQVFHEDHVLMQRLDQGYQERFHAETHSDRGISLSA